MQFITCVQETRGSHRPCSRHRAEATGDVSFTVFVRLDFPLLFGHRLRLPRIRVSKGVVYGITNAIDQLRPAPLLALDPGQWDFQYVSFTPIFQPWATMCSRNPVTEPLRRTDLHLLQLLPLPLLRL